MRVAIQKLAVALVVGAAHAAVTAVALLLALASARTASRPPAASAPRR